MKAASDDGRLLKKVAPSHRQPLTSKPAFPDWTRDAWLLIFAFTLFVFCSLLFALPLLPLRFSLLLPAIRPTASFLPTPPSRFLYPPIFHVTTPLLNFFISLPALPFSHYISFHHQDIIAIQLFRPPSLGPSALLLSAFSQTSLGSETNRMRVLVKWGMGGNWRGWLKEMDSWVDGCFRRRCGF